MFAFLIVLAFVVYQFAAQTAYTSFRSAIESDLAITLLQSGLASTVFLMVYAVMQIPAGLLLDRFGARVIVPLSMLATGGCVMLFAASDSFTSLLASRAALGLAAAFAFPAAGLVARQWLSPGYFALAMGAAECGIGLGGAAGTFGAAALEGHLGWRGSAQTFALAALPLAVLALLFIRRPPGQDMPHDATHAARAPAESMSEAFQAVIRNRVVLLACAVYAGACGVIFGLGSFWNTPLAVAWTWTHADASVINAALFVGFGAGAPVFGWLGPRVGEVRALTGALTVAAAGLVLWVLVPVDLGLTFDALNVGVIGFACGSAVLAFTLACAAVSTRHTAAAVGAVTFSGVLAGALLQLLPGFLVAEPDLTPLREQQVTSLVFFAAVLLSALAAWQIGRRPPPHAAP
ncbi:MAG: nitrate/nitrite transporter [Gammaproteobacteria bacterium]